MSQLQKSIEFVSARVQTRPRIMLVLGSGLGGLADEMSDAVRIPFADIPGFPSAAVEGHKGLLVAGKLEGVDCIAMQGRFHLYEGHAPATAGFPIRLMGALGAGTLIVSNAAGGVHPRMKGGQLMIIEDHINFMFVNPLIGPLVEGDLRFPDMSQPYDRELQDLALKVGKEQGITLERGVYFAVVGPTYETNTEVRMFGKLGADAVGMSTIPEVIVARAIGIRVLGISLITNAAAGLTGDIVTHEEVLRASEEAAPRFSALVRGVIKGLS